MKDFGCLGRSTDRFERNLVGLQDFVYSFRFRAQKKKFLGGKNHFDVYVFRNPLISNGKPQPSVYKLTDLFDQHDKERASNIMMEQVKYKVVKEFVDFIEGRISKNEVASQIEDHRTSVQIMSGVYCSHILAKEEKEPIVNYQLDRLC